MNNANGHNKNGPGLSRREFLRGGGAAAAATALTGAPVLPPDAEAAPAGHESRKRSMAAASSHGRSA